MGAGASFGEPGTLPGVQISGVLGVQGPLGGADLWVLCLGPRRGLWILEVLDLGVQDPSWVTRSPAGVEGFGALGLGV